ncbi:MAG: SAM-dependent methyltransferase, partial [Cyanobacteria bacterium P01_A01_bin.105]
HPCLSGWPSRSFFNPDYQLTQVSEAEYAFLVACDAHAADGTIQSLLGSLSVPLSEGLAVARSLQLKQLLLLEP